MERARGVRLEAAGLQAVWGRASVLAAVGTDHAVQYASGAQPPLHRPVRPVTACFRHPEQTPALRPCTRPPRCRHPPPTPLPAPPPPTELAALHMDLHHCLFVHLFLANMGHFQAANGVYCK